MELKQIHWLFVVLNLLAEHSLFCSIKFGQITILKDDLTMLSASINASTLNYVQLSKSSSRRLRMQPFEMSLINAVSRKLFFPFISVVDKLKLAPFFPEWVFDAKNYAENEGALELGSSFYATLVNMVKEDIKTKQKEWGTLGRLIPDVVESTYDWPNPFTLIYGTYITQMLRPFFDLDQSDELNVAAFDYYNSIVTQFSS